MQLIIMTSDNYHHMLNPFMYLLDKYTGDGIEPIVCGFTYDSTAKSACSRWDIPFYSIGKYIDYPASYWSDALKRVLDNVAKDTFIFMLEDYLLCRQVDMRAVSMLFEHATKNQDILKVDLCNDRLYSDPGRYLYGANTAYHIGYLDIIESPVGSQYQMSFWGGIFNKHKLLDVLVPGETAQEVELNGTTRANNLGVRVIGTRQSPMLHGNVYQGGKFVGFSGTGWEISRNDISEMRNRGYII